MGDVDGRRTGRPRDPQIRSRVLLAAQRVYVASGLPGFTFEAIAREAGVGKPALYRRWASTDELMLDVLRSHVLEPLTAPSGDIRGQLTEIAMSILQLAQSEQGAFVLRVSSESGVREGVFDKYFDRLRDVIHSSNRALVVAAIERGDLAPDCDPDVLLHSITGATLVGALLAMAPALDESRDSAEEYCRRVVDQVLQGSKPRAVRSTVPPSETG